jgi:hypothetical protein
MHLQERSANEGDNHHEQPVWNNIENPEHVSEWLSDSIQSELTVQWMEVTLILVDTPPRLIGTSILEALHTSSTDIDMNNVQITLIWTRSNVHNPKTWWSSGPRIAKNWLRVAVDVSQMWCSRIQCPQSSSLVPCGLCLSTKAEAGLITSGHEDVPLRRVN